MSTMSRWLTWTPKASIIQKTPELEPSKPSKVIFEGFEGTNPGLFQTIEPDTVSRKEPPATVQPGARTTPALRDLPQVATKLRVFPHCPRCSSFYLYRRNNIGLYECLSCGLKEIEECTARRVQ